MRLHIRKPHAPKLATSNVHTIKKDAVLGELDGVNINDSKNCATKNRQHRMGHRKSRRSDCFLLRVSRIENAVGDRYRDRIDINFVFMNLNRSQDGVFNSDLGANVVKLKTRFRGPVWLAIAADSPAGNECAVSHNNTRATHGRRWTTVFACWTSDAQWSSSHQESIHGEATAFIHRDRKRIRRIRLPIE